MDDEIEFGESMCVCDLMGITDVCMCGSGLAVPPGNGGNTRASFSVADERAASDLCRSSGHLAGGQGHGVGADGEGERDENGTIDGKEAVTCEDAFADMLVDAILTQLHPNSAIPPRVPHQVTPFSPSDNHGTRPANNNNCSANDYAHPANNNNRSANDYAPSAAPTPIPDRSSAPPPSSSLAATRSHHGEDAQGSAHGLPTTPLLASSLPSGMTVLADRSVTTPESPVRRSSSLTCSTLRTSSETLDEIEDADPTDGDASDSELDSDPLHVASIFLSAVTKRFAGAFPAAAAAEPAVNAAPAAAITSMATSLAGWTCAAKAAKLAVAERTAANVAAATGERLQRPVAPCAEGRG